MSPFGSTTLVSPFGASSFLTSAAALDAADHIVLTDIYAAGERPMPGVTLDVLAATDGPIVVPSGSCSDMLIHLQLNTVRVKPPISHTAAAFKSTLGRLDGPFDASSATDHDTLLEALACMTVDAEQIFKKAHSISAHGILIRPAADRRF